MSMVIVVAAAEVEAAQQRCSVAEMQASGAVRVDVRRPRNIAVRQVRAHDEQLQR